MSSLFPHRHGCVIKLTEHKPNMELIKLTIDGRPIEAVPGKTILEVARENNIYIPTLCFHENLLPFLFRHHSLDRFIQRVLNQFHRRRLV